METIIGSVMRRKSVEATQMMLDFFRSHETVHSLTFIVVVQKIMCNPIFLNCKTPHLWLLAYLSINNMTERHYIVDS